MPESIGQTLKKAREANRLSLEEASDRTRIPKKILLTIEEDRLEEISSDFYAKNFVKSYARFLGAIDEESLKEYLSEPRKEDKTQKVIRTRRFPAEWIIKHKKHIVIFSVAILSAILVFFSLVQIKRLAGYILVKHEEHVEKKRVDTLNLEISARSDTWIQIMGDGRLLFRGILKKKEKDVWQAKKELKLNIGNAGGLVLKLNGKDLGPLGKKGEKKEIVITKNGIQL